MSEAKTISLTLPAETLARAEALAKRESRTIGELVRDALRQYERKRLWAAANLYGRSRAAAAGIEASDVERLIGEYRREKRTRARPKK